METNELKNLLEKLKNKPKDLDLINQIAIGYLRNHEICKNNEDYKFFKKAYNIKKTVKSTHNFANYLFHEKYDNKKALKVQKECIDLNPKSHYPYLLYGEILIELKQYFEAIKILERSKKIKKTWNAEHNLGCCKYMLGDYKGAEKHFLKISKDKESDNELKSTFGLVLVNYRLGNKDKVYKLLEKMQKSEYFDNAINNYDIGIIYFLYDDFENAKNNTLKCDINFIDLFDWKELGYSILKNDKELFYKQVNKRINEMNSYFEKVKENTDMPENEKQEYFSYYMKEINEKQNAEKIFKIRPKVDIDKHLVGEYYGCSIFGCCVEDELEN